MRNPLRRVALWLVLAVLFVVFYNFFAKPPEASGAAQPGIWGVMLLQFTPVLGLAVPFGLFMLLVRKLTALNGEGMALAHQGRMGEALAKYARARRYWKWSAALNYNIGRAELSRWQLSAGISELEKLNGSWFKGLKRLIPPPLALAFALQGQAESARKWLEQVHANHHDAAPEALLASAVLACRAQNWPEARTVLERYELRAIGGMPRGLADALRAWTLKQLNGPQLMVDRVGVLGEASNEQIQQVWPEFAAFLESAPSV